LTERRSNRTRTGSSLFYPWARAERHHRAFTVTKNKYSTLRDGMRLSVRPSLLVLYSPRDNN